jgi:hypothetical protein
MEKREQDLTEKTLKREDDMRFEHKFLVPKWYAAELRERILPFVVPDPHGCRGEITGYTVRSIYYDTCDFEYYHEKLSGLKVRKKLRLRGYDDRCEDGVVFLEIKRKEDGAVSKNRAPVAYDSVNDLFRTGDIERYVSEDCGYPLARENAGRFLYHYHRSRLRPVVLVVYRREAYHGRFDRMLRITFDSELRSIVQPSIGDLFSEEGIVRTSPEVKILEVKFNGQFPNWLSTILRLYGLQRQAFSKYCVCLGDHSSAACSFSPRSLHLPFHPRTLERRTP